MKFHSILVCAAAVLVCLSRLSPADETLYRYEGDVHPLDPGAGWVIGNPCDPPCTEFLENGHFVYLWPIAGDFASYHLWIPGLSQPSPPSLWIEWRFRSNFPLGPILVGCDASFSVKYIAVVDSVDLYGDAVVTFEGSEFVLGLDIDSFHTFRFESLDGHNYFWSVDGIKFSTGFDAQGQGTASVQMRGLGGCNSDWHPNMKNEWDYVRYGTIAHGEQVVGTDPPQGALFENVHGSVDRFTMTFDSANYVYLDEITVSTTVGIAPEVIQTLRREWDEPDTVEIVLDRPLPMEGVTTFTFDDGTIMNVVSYQYASPTEDADHDGVANGEDKDPLDPHVCRDVDGDLCDDCAIGVDGDGPLPDFDPANDGPDSDGDGVCDVSDNCVDVANPDQADGDGDGVGDVCDECPVDVNKIVAGICGCGAPDEGDADGDTVLDCVDQCPGLDDLIDTDNDGLSDCVQHIPTVGAWGLVILTLLLLTLAKIVGFPPSASRAAGPRPGGKGQ